MRLIGEEEAKRRGLDRLFYGSDPMVMEDPVSITPGGGVREREKALHAAFDAAAASGVTPERASEDLRLSRSTGIPFGMISESDRMRNSALLDEHRRACRESFARAAREAPAASRFLSKPENMLFARNDAGALTETERWFEVPLRSLKANSLETRINALYGEAVLSGMNESIENEIAKLTAERQALGEIPEGAVNNYLWNAFSMFPQLWEQGKRGVKTGLLWGAGGALGAALLGQAGPQAALPEEVLTVPAAFGIMGTQGVFYGMAEKGFYIEAGAAYNEYRQIPNVDDDSARLMAFLTGGVNALIERASLGTLAKTFPGGSAAVQRMLGRKAIREALSNPTTRRAIAEFAKTYAKGISIDTVQEVTQEFMNIVGGDILKSQVGEATSSVEEIAARLGETAVQSVMAESLIYLPGPALGLRNNLRRARSASVTAESFAKAAEVMDSTEVKNIAPSVAEQYVREAIAGTGKETSYVPASKVVELYQSSDLEELRETFPEVLGVTEAESIKAMEDGIDIEIDSAKLLNADKSLRDAVLPFVSFEPDGMSQADAERLAKWSEKSMEKGVEAANFEMERERRYVESARKVAESKRMELETVGRDPETAAAEAELVGNMYVTLARRWNEAMPRKDGREYLPEDIARMYPISLTRSEDGSGKITGLTMNQTAWHGSPFRFDRFSTENIGTGEGAQVYGWGLYFAGNKAVARDYRSKLTDARGEDIFKVKYEGRTAWEWNKYWEKMAEAGGEDSQKYRDYVSLLDDYRDMKEPADIVAEAKARGLSAEAIEWFDKTIAQSKARPGALYKVDIPDDGDYLVWDRSVPFVPKEQMDRIFETMMKHHIWFSKKLLFDGIDISDYESVQTLLDEKYGDFNSTTLYHVVAGIRGGKTLDEAIEYAASEQRDLIEWGENSEDVEKTITWLNENRDKFSFQFPYSEWGGFGWNLYDKLSEALGNNPKAASLLLKEAGIPGIKYLDGNSRHAGEGSYNYVIFDDADVNIVETYYQQGANAGENLRRAMPDKVFNSFDEARAYLREQIKKAEKGVENESDGIAVSLAANGIKKMLSIKATEKSQANGFSIRDHITAAANILKLYKNSELLFTHSDKKHRANVTQIKRFGAPVIVPDSQEAAVAYITVREVRGTDNNLYSVELVSFELLKAEKMPPGTLRSSPHDGGESERPAGGDLTVAEGGENVNAEEAEAEKMPPGNFRTSLTEEEIAQPAGGDLTVAESEVDVNSEEAVSGEAASDGFARLAEKYEKVNEELKQFEQKASANIRGSITFPSRRGQPVRINFSPSANRSTFMHEMAHFYLYQLRQMEAVNDGGNYTAWNYSPPSWISDLRTISSWWNENAEEICEWIKKEDFSDEVKDGAGAEAFQSWLISGMETNSEIGRAFDRSAHEYFARGFERYLEEGRAPTAALQKVFRRFKRWLTEIYRDFIGLNVELSDDVRGVFDRMVATEDAIEVFRAERDIEAAFGRDVTEEEALNISPFSDEDEFAEADERLLSRLLDEVSPEARKRMTDYAEEIRPGIVRAVANSRPYRVLSILENAPEMRINEQSFVDAVGDTVAASMPEGLLTKEGGLDFGYGLKNLEYPSVDEFLSDFSGLSDFKTAVDARVYNEVARRFVSAASSEDGMREAVNRAWYEGTEHAEKIAAEASIDDFADIYAADEAARAAAESPTNRTKVAEFVKSHGFIKYESVVQEFGREQARALHKRAPFLFRTSGFGLDELAQEMRGNGIPVESDEHLFNILMGADAPRSPIDTAHEQGYAEGRASVLYGYGKSEDEARSRRRALDRALKDSVGKEKAKQKMESAKMAAENIVRSMTVEDLRKVVPFVRAEKNARMNAESALRRGDEAGFRDWKEKELLNNSVVRQMYKSQREAEVIRAWLERYKNRTQKQTFGMDVKFLKQVDAMLSRVGLRRMRSLTEAQRKAAIDAEPLTKFIENMAEEGTPIMLPDWITESSVERHYSQFMLWQLKDIQNVVKNIVTAGRQEKRLISLSQNIAFSDAEDEIIAGAKKFYGDKVSGESSRMRVENAEKESRVKLAKDYYDDLFTPEAICRTIDGYADGGAMQRYVFRPVREGQSRVCLELNEIFAKFRKLKEDCYGNKKFSNDKTELDVPVYERLADKERPGHYIYIPTNEKQRFTRENLVCFGLNLGNEGNIARLKNSGFTDRDINFIKNKLTAEDWKYIQGVWDLLETMWPKIQKVHELMTGTIPEPVKAQPVVTKYGKFRGGYYPIVTDLRYSLSAAAQKEQREVMTSAPMGFGIAQTESGHRKARAENVEGRPLLFELSVLDNHVANVVYDYEMTHVIRDVRKLLKRDRIQRLIEDVLGEHQARNLNKWLNDVAANTKNNGLSMDTKDRLVNKAISGTAMFSLGANVGGALMQPLGYFPLAHRIGGVNAALAVLKGLRHPEETWRLAHEKSAFMREQMDGTNAEVRNLRQNWSSQGKKLNAVQDRMLSIYPFFQNMCNVPGWCQSYYVGMKKFNGDEKEAIAYADAVIRQTQGASGIADLSTFERGGVVARFFSMFYSWFRVQYQMQTEAIRKAYYGRGLKGRMGDLASYVFYVLVAQSVAEGLLRGDLPDDEDDPLLVSWAKWTAKRATVSTLSTLPMVRDATSFVDNNFGYRVSPAASAFESVYRLGESAKKFLSDPDDEWTDAVDLLEPAATVAGYYYGVPNRKMIQAAKAFWAWYDEDEAIPWAYLVLGSGFKPKDE